MATPSMPGDSAHRSRSAAAASTAAFPPRPSIAAPRSAASSAGPVVLQFHDVTFSLPDGQALWARPLNVAVGQGVIGSFAALLAGGVLLLAIFFVAARRMRIEELNSLVGMVRGRLGR